MTLLFLRAPRPTARQFASLTVVVVCLVFGFSWMLAEALRHVPSYHAAIVAGSIPLVVAFVAVVRERERQSALFWMAAIAGALVVIGYALSHSGWEITAADGLLLVGAVACGIGYAEGARVGREIGSLAASCWVPILATPFALILCVHRLPADWQMVSPNAWMAVAYNGVFSCWLGFVFWYRGLAAGGIARVGQLQLLQPFFTLVLVALWFHEAIELQDWLATAAVFACVVVAQASSRRLSAGNVNLPVTGSMPVRKPASAVAGDR